MRLVPDAMAMHRVCVDSLVTSSTFRLAGLSLIVQAPPSELGALSEFLSNLKEIPRDCLLFGKEIGSGEFGAVFEGVLVN